MGIFSRFSKNKKVVKNESPFMGGNGLSLDAPVYIDCASGGMAEHLIDRFISEKHGQKGIDWQIEVSFTVESAKTNCGMVKSIVVKTKQEELNYYFDLSRPMANLQKFTGH